MDLLDQFVYWVLREWRQNKKSIQTEGLTKVHSGLDLSNQWQKTHNCCVQWHHVDYRGIKQLNQNEI